MMLIRSFVAPSGIEGVRVFAAENIKKGDVVWKLDTKFDRLVETDQMKEFPPHMQEFMTRYAYPLHDQPKTLVLEADNGRFMNHSHNPNSDFKEIVVGYATRDIAEGEEILCDYSEFVPSHELLPSLLPLMTKKESEVA
ncbi:SET domain-containing protein [Litorimonas haliclonae]|uniref:SET domain-containing protein n=1 Tax=Litorimonas haliclonae TaxID=2081977 RepID=UPI0039EF5060